MEAENSDDKSGRYESSRKWEWGYLRVSFKNLKLNVNKIELSLTERMRKPRNRRILQILYSTNAKKLPGNFLFPSNSH